MAVPGSEQPNPSPNPDAAQPAPRGAVRCHEICRHAGSGNLKSSSVCWTFVGGTFEHRCRPPAATFGMGGRNRISHRMVPRFLPLLSSSHSFRTQLGFQDWVSLGVRARSRYQVPAEISHLGGSYAGPHIRDLRALHAPGVHARLETQRKQIQVSLPRQRVRQRRNQLRGTGSPTHGPGQG